MWKYGTSINISSKTQEKEATQGNILELFLQDTLKSVERKSTKGKSNPKMDTIRVFLSKIRTLFSIFKKGRGALPSPLSCMLVIATELASISLNIIPKYPWKCLNKQLFWLCQNSQYHLKCLTGIWRFLLFKISQDSEYDTVLYARGI